MRLKSAAAAIPLLVSSSACLQVLGLGDYREGAGGGTGGRSMASTVASVGGAGGGTICTPGVSSDCYDGPKGTLDVGNCKRGAHSCEPGGASYGACAGEVLPAAENCDHLGDEDCDGLSCSETVWAGAFGDPSAQNVTALAVDPSGDVYVAGQFGGAMKLGATMLIAPHGTADIFIAKLAADGTPLWAKAFGSVSTDYVHALAADVSGVVVFGGSSSGQQVDLGGSPTGRVFLAKFDPNGAIVWSRDLAGGSAIPNPPGALALDSSGGIVVGANLAGTVDCGGGPLAGSAGSNDIVVARFGSGGQYQWARRYFGTAASRVTGVAVDFAGDVLLSGAISSTTNFQGGMLIASDWDPLLLKVKGDGSNVLWKKNLSGAGDSYATSLALDPAGGAVLAGNVGGTLAFGSGKNFDSAAGDMFVAKFGTAGSFGWAQQLGTSVDNSGMRSVSVDSAGAISVVGSVSATTTIGTHVLVASSQTGFVAKYDSGGNSLWAREVVQGATTSSANVVRNGPKDRLLVGGQANGSTLNFGVTPIVGQGGDDAFVVEIDP